MYVDDQANMVSLELSTVAFGTLRELWIATFRFAAVNNVSFNFQER